MTRKRKKEIYKQLFPDYVDKPMREMSPGEKLDYLWIMIYYNKHLKKRPLNKGKEHKEIVIPKDNPEGWYCKIRDIRIII